MLKANAVPAFRHMGGKARLRKWLVSHFPSDGRAYVEPFAGKGNVYFHAVRTLSYQSWLLADTNVDFLTCLRLADLSQLPRSVEREEFAIWRERAKSVDPLAVILEPRITYAGKGYKYGFSGSSGTHVGYSGVCYRVVCERARELLERAAVIQDDWQVTLGNLLSPGYPNDFVYLDPPYYGVEANYGNIDHEHLVASLNYAPFRWALSGYANDVYDGNLRYKRRLTCERNSEIKSSNTRGRSAVTEVLWLSY